MPEKIEVYSQNPKTREWSISLCSAEFWALWVLDSLLHVCLNQFFITMSKYLRKTTQRRTSLLWLMIAEASFQHLVLCWSRSIMVEGSKALLVTSWVQEAVRVKEPEMKGSGTRHGFQTSLPKFPSPPSNAMELGSQQTTPPLMKPEHSWLNYSLTTPHQYTWHFWGALLS